jgi:hypothetical protein
MLYQLSYLAEGGIIPSKGFDTPQSSTGRSLIDIIPQTYLNNNGMIRPVDDSFGDSDEI